jgi:sulfatase modifying factor 1
MIGLARTLGWVGAFAIVGCGGSAAGIRPVTRPPETLSPAAAVRPLPPPSAPPVALPPPRPPASCPDDMVDVGVACIDRYEAPNSPGEMPFALQTAFDGESWCANRGKRLCTENEWVRACEGPDGREYPYGDDHLDGVCNDGRAWIPVRWDLLARWPSPVAVAEAKRLFQGEASGTRSACVSAEGVHDLTGNVAEWVRRAEPPPRPGYEHVLKGCYWAGCYHEPHPNCVFRNSAHPGTFRTYEAGFRCCRDRG